MSGHSPAPAHRQRCSSTRRIAKAITLGAHLKEFGGVIHADGYAGFNELFAGNRIVEAACWAHPWTAPSAQGKVRHVWQSRSCAAIHSALRRGAPAAGPDEFAAPFPITLADFPSDAPIGLYGAR